MNLRTYLARLKRKISKKPFFKDPAYPPYWFDVVLGGQKASIVQIGSNDGKTGDPLHPLFQKNVLWEGLFVEPVPYLFERLKSNYSNENRFRFENVAINDGHDLDFYWVASEAKDEFKDLPYWYDQLGSFDRNHIVKELGDRIENYIRSKTLEGMTLERLFENKSITHIDILHIDTEGYDWKILSQLDLEKLRPSFILYEKNHLSDIDLKASMNFLKQQYELFSVGIDMFAVNKEVGDDLLDDIRSKIFLPENFKVKNQ